MSKAITFKTNTGEKIYPSPYMPIGSIYFSTSNTNPSTYFGGTWERFAKGRVIVGVDENQTEFNTVNKTGGSKYLQKHYHDIRYGNKSGSGVTISNVGSGVQVLNIDNWTWTKNTASDYGSGANVFTNERGSGNSENLQPYIAVYIWRRIS